MHFSLPNVETPRFPAVCEELFRPPVADLAAWLGVHPDTVKRWQRTGRAPRAVELALHLVSRPGLYEMHTAILRDLRAVDDWGLAMQRENEALRRELARVVAAGDFGSANRPTFKPPAVAPVRMGRPRG